MGFVVTVDEVLMSLYVEEVLLSLYVDEVLLSSYKQVFRLRRMCVLLTLKVFSQELFLKQEKSYSGNRST